MKQITSCVVTGKLGGRTISRCQYLTGHLYEVSDGAPLIALPAHTEADGIARILADRQHTQRPARFVIKHLIKELADRQACAHTELRQCERGLQIAGTGLDLRSEPCTPEQLGCDMAIDIVRLTEYERTILQWQAIPLRNASFRLVGADAAGGTPATALIHSRLETINTISSL